MQKQKRHLSIRTLFLIVSICAILLALTLIPLRQYHAEQKHLSRLSEKCPSLGQTTLIMGPDWLCTLVFYTTGSLNMLERVVAIDVSGDSNRNGNFPSSRIDFDDHDLAEMQRIFPHLRELCLTRTNVTDSSVPVLLKFSKLHSVFLHEALVSENGITEIRDSKQFLVNSK